MKLPQLHFPYLPPGIPGEFSFGLFGRTLALNSIGNEQALRYFSGMQTPSGFCPHESLGGHTQEGLAHILLHHTLAPFYAYSLSTRPMAPFKDELANSAPCVFQRVPRIPTYSALCNHCLDEDMKLRGISFWRRQHHLPGVLRCHAHGTELRRSSNTAAFACQPHAVVHSDIGEWHPFDWRVTAEPSDTVDLYDKIAMQMLKDHSLVRVEAMWCRIEVLADKHRTRTLKADEHTYLMQAISSAFPAVWLQAVFPRGFESALASCIFAVGIFRLLFKAPATKTLICAVIALSESSEEAAGIFGLSEL